MATLWTWPVAPQASAAGVAITAVALTGSGISPLPEIPVGVIQNGARLRLKATMEVTSTSVTPTFTTGFYIGSFNQVIGSKTVIAITGANAISATAVSWMTEIDYDGTFRTLSGGGGVAAAGVINGTGIVHNWANVGLTGTPTINILPVTLALRTVSTLQTNQVNELDVGVTLSSATGSPSILVTNFWAEVSG